MRMTAPDKALHSFRLLALSIFLAACGGGGGGGTPVAGLSSLTISDGALAPAFQPATLNYSATVPFTVDSVTLVPTTGTAAATITVNGSAVASGQASAPIDLQVGQTSITVAVSATGASGRTYTVVVTREEEVFAKLSALELGSGSIVPSVFNPENLSYSSEQGYLASSIQLRPTATLAGSVIEVNGSAVASGELSQPIALEPGAETDITIAVSAAGATARSYELSVSRQSAGDFVAEVQQAEPASPAPVEGAGFGARVALDGDTLAIGVPGESSDGAGTAGALPGSGGVYVFEYNGSSWELAQLLKASNAAEGAGFGSSIALQNGLLVAGAPSTTPDAGLSFVGSAYVFRQDNGVWVEEAVLAASNFGPGHRFGSAVATDAGRIAVGAPGEGTLEESSGAIYLYSHDGVVWSEDIVLRQSNPVPFAQFGISVALNGVTLAGGAPFENTNAANEFVSDGTFDDSGGVYVFLHEDGSWSEQAYLRADMVAEGERFGISLALLADTLAVGSNRAVTEDPLPGQVHVFGRSGSTWTTDTVLEASNAAAGDWFGISLALANDVLIVGAERENSVAAQSGAVYVFGRNGPGWTEVTREKAETPFVGAAFGAAVALSGGRLAVGAPGDSSVAAGAGKVYVID